MIKDLLSSGPGSHLYIIINTFCLFFHTPLSYFPPRCIIAITKFPHIAINLSHNRFLAFPIQTDQTRSYLPTAEMKSKTSPAVILVLSKIAVCVCVGVFGLFRRRRCVCECVYQCVCVLSAQAGEGLCACAGPGFIQPEAAQGTAPRSHWREGRQGAEGRAWPHVKEGVTHLTLHPHSSPPQKEKKNPG